MLRDVQVQVLFAALKRNAICIPFFLLFLHGRGFMLAVFVNCGAIIIGSLIGILFAKKISDEVNENIMNACGVVTFVLGVQMAFKFHNIVFMTLSMIIGGCLGTIWNLDGKILRFGMFLQKITGGKSENPVTEINDKTENQRFAYAFLNASVLFCVGAMAIVGSFKAGIEKDYSIIFTKSILDGFIAISYASAMGIGTAFSAIAILIYQGGLTLLSLVLEPLINQEMIDEVSAVGGAIIVMIGINLLGFKKIKTANFLPALFVEIIFVSLAPIVVGGLR